MTANYRIALMSAAAALALSGCTANGTGRIASIGTSAIAEASDGDANTGGGTGGGGGSDVSPAVGTGTDRAATDGSDTDEGTKSGPVMNGGAMTAPDDGGNGGGGAGGDGVGNASGPDGVGSGGGSGGTPATPRPRRAMLVTAGNAVLTGSAMAGGIDVGGAVTTVQGTITQLLDQAGTALVDLGNGQSALVQQAGAIVGAVINVSTPAGSLLPSGGRPGAVGIALLAPDPAVGTVAAVSVLPTANSGQLASVVLSGAPIASAIAATAGAVPIVPTEALTNIANGLVAANVAGTSVGGGQALIAASVASPTPATASLATATATGAVPATVTPTLTATVATPVAGVTQMVSAASTLTVSAVTAPTIATPAIVATVATAPAVVAPAITAAVMPTITAAPTVAIVPSVAIAPPVAIAPTVAVAPSVSVVPSVSANPTVTAPVSVVVGLTGAAVAAPITAAVTTGPLAGGALIH